MPSASKGIPEEEAEVLQAVILADSFNKRFKPLTSDRPKVFCRVHFVYRV
jgi:translation initiation factor eIF-2B subunit epsilon